MKYITFTVDETKQCTPFAKLDFPTIFKGPEMPPYKRVVVWIDMSGDK